MTIKTLEGNFTSKGLKIAIVISRFNNFITAKLQEGAIDSYVRHEGLSEDLTLYKIPGAFEIPLTCQKIAQTKKYDGIVALGAVIRGDTPHFDYVANEVTKGVAQVSLNSGVPIAFGVLTTDNIEQAIERAGSKAGNKGSEAMISVIETINLFKSI